MKFKALIPLLLLITVGFVQFLPSEAIGAWPAPTDYAMNFDNFAIGKVSPFPWTLSIGTCTNFVYGEVNHTVYRSAPNSYDMEFKNACASTQWKNLPTLTAVFNATEATVNTTMYYAADVPTYAYNMTVETATQTLSATCLNPCTGSTTWAKLSTLVATTPGTTVTVTLSINATSNAVHHGYFDDFSIIGAAAYTSSQGGPAINFRLLNDSSAGPYLFDPSGYAGSVLTVNYPLRTNSSNTWSNAPAGGFSLGAAFLYDTTDAKALGTASLITFWVGSQYSRSLIPEPSGATNMYVDNPSTVLAYDVSVIGPAGNSPSDFPPGSDIFIQQGGHNITSGYLSSVQDFLAYLVPGVYTVVLIDGSSKNTQTVSFADVAGSKVTVNVFGAPITFPSGIVTTQAFGVVWASTAYNSLTLNYQDKSGTSTQVGIVIAKTNSSGTFDVYVSYSAESATPGTLQNLNFTISMPVSSPNLSRNYSNQMAVTVYSTSSYFGTNQTVGTMGIPLAVCSGCVFPSSNINLPGDVLGLSTVFLFVTWPNIVALLIITLSASSFGFLSARFGFLILSLEIDFFGAISWLPWQGALVTSLPLLAITAILVASNKGR